ncbi:TIGR02996 domain-containing protein [Gemmata sp.]|uniref:TIGR02996 domain-containing protein n=1 Tax=Gemmata sp. TaxID=1914242 RepID=UPI003F6EFDC5
MGIFDWFRRSRSAPAQPRNPLQASPRPFDVPAGLVSEEAAFLRGLEADPADDTLRLVYADWLQEWDDHRHEFLRAAVAMRAAVVSGECVPGLVHHVRYLRKTVPAEWVVWADRSLAEDDVREPVFRSLLGEGLRDAEIFLRVDYFHDPSPYLMAGLVDGYPEAKPVSVAKRGSEGVHYDRRTLRYGSVWCVHELAWESESCCNAEGSFHGGSLAAFGNLFRVGIQEGAWTVLSESTSWTS